MIRTDPNQLEVSLFGPGYGESVAIHFGAGQWIVVDSCYDRESGMAAPLAYFEKMGIDPKEAVKLIVATHWHDDHVRGLSEIVEACPQGQFVCASALTKLEFITIVSRFNVRNKIEAGTGVQEMHAIFKTLKARDQQAMYALPNRLIFRSDEAAAIAGGDCTVTTLSPSDKQLELFWDEITSLMPAARDQKRRATSKSPNHVAVVLWVAAGDQSVLLGSDLEENGDVHLGWSAIIGSGERPRESASVFKVAHHGSSNAHHDGVWSEMVVTDPYAILTPFVRGNVSLPTAEDVERIRARSRRAYITSNGSRAPVRRSPTVQRAMRDAVSNLKKAEAPLGHLRMRRRYLQDASWNVQMIGPAARLK